MTSFWHRWYRPLTALALFAMLLAFTGPLISQMQRLMEMPVGTMAEMPRHGDAEPHVHGQPQAVDEVHILHHFDMAACGYCELFLHAPGLELPQVLPPSAPPPSARRRDLALHHSGLSQLRLPRAAPRLKSFPSPVAANAASRAALPASYVLLAFGRDSR